jgi:hypothetical protein
MGNMRAQLSHEEEVTLRRIALGSASLRRLRMTDVRRLRHLMLIEGEGENCRLTALGRQRFNKLARPTPHTRHDLMREIDRILAIRGPSPKGDPA